MMTYSELESRYREQLDKKKKFKFKLLQPVIQFNPWSYTYGLILWRWREYRSEWCNDYYFMPLYRVNIDSCGHKAYRYPNESFLCSIFTKLNPIK